MPLRVFVSHSAREDDAVAVQKKLVDRLSAEPAKFTLLMDRSELAVGDRWRARINFWIGSCDVAVVLLSPAALDSAYVAYEVSVLAYRAGVPNSKFRIIPVYLKDVDHKRLAKSRLDPAKLTEIQRLAKKKTADEIADAVMEELSTIADMPPRPIDAIIKRVQALLKGVPETTIEKASDKLPDFKLPWEPDQDAIRPLAERLLAVGMAGASAALVELCSDMSERRIQELVELIACTWVDIKAVESLPKIARSSALRVVALNAMKTETARMYHLAASGGSPSWMFVPCNNKFAESVEATIADQITTNVRAALTSRITPKPPDTVEDTLEAIKENFVVLVAMPAEGLLEDSQVALALGRAFPTVTFFFLTGSTPDEDIDEIVERIIPQLQENDENEFHSAYSKLNTNVYVALQNKGLR